MKWNQWHSKKMKEHRIEINVDLKIINENIIIKTNQMFHKKEVFFWFYTHDRFCRTSK